MGATPESIWASWTLASMTAELLGVRACNSLESPMTTALEADDGRDAEGEESTTKEEKGNCRLTTGSSRVGATLESIWASGSVIVVTLESLFASL